MNIGDIVIVINDETVPTEFLGRYGRIKNIGEYKVTVEFNVSVKGIGGLSHTAVTSDLKKFG